MRAFQGAFRKQHPVVGDNAYRITKDSGETGDQGGAVIFLKFLERAAINDAGDNFTNIKGLARVLGDKPQKVFGRIKRIFRFLNIQLDVFNAV